MNWNDLPKFSPWPARLLGNSPFAARNRTREEVIREYHKDKWGTVLAALQARSGLSDRDLLEMQGVQPDKIQPFMVGDEFFTAPASEILERYFQILLEIMGQQNTETLVELGCGLGDKLLKAAAHFQSRNVHGGEFTGAGVECGRLLAARAGIGATFGHFDYNDPQTLSQIPRNAMVFTSHSIEQIPSLNASFVEALIRRSPRQVIHFEPVYEDQDATSMIGLMRRRYTEVNDYNKNLLGVLRACEKKGLIRIFSHRPNIFSDTPFNPTSVILWAPA